ncbi:MAG: helix-turn-helix transcriptional regulator [Smithella sp.]
MQSNEYDRKFGENLQSLRRRKNLTQQELGERIGIGHSSISLWEKGERSPSVSQVYLLCRVLGCTPGEMLDMKPPVTQEQGRSIQWITNFPTSNSLNYTENILDGIHLFQYIAFNGLDYMHLSELESFSTLNPQQLWNKINAAFTAKGIEIVSVNETLGEKKR